jgi:hypothetical protein
MTGTFEGVGSLQFSPDNKYAYAYSGTITLTGTGAADDLCLDFDTNSEYIVGGFQWSNTETNATRDSYIEIHFNDQKVYGGRWENPNSIEKSTPIYFVIPPFTNVKCYQGNDGTTQGYFTMTGKVHGAIEQENLEAITNNNKWASL